MGILENNVRALAQQLIRLVQLPQLDVAAHQQRYASRRAPAPTDRAVVLRVERIDVVAVVDALLVPADHARPIPSLLLVECLPRVRHVLVLVVLRIRRARVPCALRLVVRQRDESRDLLGVRLAGSREQSRIERTGSQRVGERVAASLL